MEACDKRDKSSFFCVRRPYAWHYSSFQRTNMLHWLNHLLYNLWSNRRLIPPPLTLVTPLPNQIDALHFAAICADLS